MAMSAVECTVHLLCLQQDVSNDDLLRRLTDPSSGQPSYLIKAKAHGWVHRPHLPSHKELLLAHRWDVFVLTKSANLPGTVGEAASARLSIQVSIPKDHYDLLESEVETLPKANLETPPLPKEWREDGGIPLSAVRKASVEPLKVGELNLDAGMAHFLSTSLPDNVRYAPVGLFNLFMYPKGDPSVHEHYMEGFKRDFGDAAGVAMKFMGPVKSEIEYETSAETESQQKSSTGWQDANLVQYDTIWHYAYMLSTDTYAQLNKEKISGLDDTCILLTSEMELAQST